MKRIIMIILCLVWWSNTVSAQCYTKMMDASGITLDASDLKMLEDSACALKTILPQAVRDSFSIVDFGFYAQNENMVGGYPEFMDLMIQELAADPKSKYYILFARESSSKGGPNSKIWVKVKLPTWGQFSCMVKLSKSLVKDIELSIGSFTNLNLRKDYNFVEAEQKSISKLKIQLKQFIDCCETRSSTCSGCVLKPIDVFTKIQDGNPTIADLVAIESDPDFFDVAAKGVGISKSKLNVKIRNSPNSEVIDLDAFIADYVQQFKEDFKFRFGIDPSVSEHIFKYPRDCSKLGETLNEFNNSSAQFKLHVSLINLDNKTGLVTFSMKANSGNATRGANTSVFDDEIEGLREAADGQPCNELIGAALGHVTALNLQTRESYFFLPAEQKKLIDDIVEQSRTKHSEASERFGIYWTKEHSIMLPYHLKHDDYGTDNEYCDKWRAEVSTTWHLCSESIHTILDACGIIPVVGEVCDGTNALLYLAGGDIKNAALSGVAMIPLIGSSAVATKYGGKLWSVVGKTGSCLVGGREESVSLGCDVLSFTVKFGKITWTAGRTKLSSLMIKYEDIAVWTVNGKVYKYIKGVTEAHHIIPWEFCQTKQHQFVKWAAQSGWHPSDILANGFPIPRNIHREGWSHVEYSRYVEKELNNLATVAKNKFAQTPESMSKEELKIFSDFCKKEMDDLTEKLRVHIGAAIESNKNLNEYFKTLK